MLLIHAGPIALRGEAQAAFSECQRIGACESKILKHLNRRDDAIWSLIRARTPNKWMLIEKLQLLLRLMDEHSTDRRDLVLAASILRDVQQIGQRVMSKILDTIDELNRGRNLVHAAYMAARGIGLDGREMNAMACVLGQAEDALENVEARLEKMKDEERSTRTPVADAG